MRRVDNANQSAGAGAGAGAGSFNNYQFDFGLGNGFPKGSSNAPLKDQKQPGSSPWSSPLVPQQPPSASRSAAASSGWSAGGSYQASSGWSSQNSMGGGGGGGSKTPSQSSGWSGYQPMTQGLGGANKSAGLGAGSGSGSGSGSLGGIGIGGGGGGFNKSMNGAPMMKSSSSSSSFGSDSSKLASAGVFGLAQNQSSKGADVFGDLLGPALNRSNAPLNSQPGPKLPFAMGKLDSSLPKPEGGAGSSEQQIPLSKMAKPRATAAAPPPQTPLAPAPAPAPAPASEPMATRRSTQNSAERDPFPPVSAGSSSSNVSYESDFFSFPSAPSPAVNGPSGGVSQDDPFGLSGGSADPFGFGSLPNQSVPQQQSARSTTSSPSPMAAGGDPLDMFKAPPSAASAQQSPAAAQDDGWGMFDTGEGSSAMGDNVPTTTELEGLPPPPVGVTAQAATEKGSEFFKNGQFPDAIKWFSWSLELLKKGKPSKELLLENLSCRVSCYKEIGEMKKAVADCTQAIGIDKANTSLIMQRSNLYESMEKYKLGVADLKLVLKIDNNHRQARSTLMRLERMVDQ